MANERLSEHAKTRNKERLAVSNKVIKDGESISFEGVKGNTVELNVTLDIKDAKKAGLKVFKGAVNETQIYYDSEKGTVVIDRSRSGANISGAESNRSTRSVEAKLENGKVSFRIFLDVSSVEVFINGGYSTLTANVYPDANDINIEFFSKGGEAVLDELSKYNINVE